MSLQPPLRYPHRCLKSINVSPLLWPPPFLTWNTTAASGLLYPLPPLTPKNPHVIRESNKNEEEYLFCNFNRPCKKTISNKLLFLVITIKPSKTSFKLAATYVTCLEGARKMPGADMKPNA